MEVKEFTVKNLKKCIFEGKFNSKTLSISLKYNKEIEEWVNTLKKEENKQVYISNEETYKNIYLYINKHTDLYLKGDKITVTHLFKCINKEYDNGYTYDILIKPYISKDNKYINFRVEQIEINLLGKRNKLII